jgi:3-hydroxyisobutyrate dehydrogenase-like beta-hydroxyacid dehydrogenase
MGSSMAGHLVDAGHDVEVHNRTRARAAAVIEKGAKWRDSPAEVAADAEAVLLMLGYPTDVRETVLGEGRVLEALKPGSLLIDMTTSEPGAGQHCKMVNQTAIAAGMIGLCEALLYAHRAGLDLEQTIATIQGGAAGSWSLSNYGPRILRGDLEPGFKLDHFVKDLGIALAEARRMKLSLPGTALAEQLYIAAQGIGLGEKGTHALSVALGRVSGGDWPVDASA